MIDNPWSSLWHEIAQAEWVANVGVPLLATLVALLFAGWVLRSQIASDNRLSRESVRADRRLGVGLELAGVLVELKGWLLDTPVEHSAWLTPSWYLSDEIRRAIRSAAHVIEDSSALDTYRYHASLIDRIWMASVVQASKKGWLDRWEKDDVTGDVPTLESHIYALQDLVLPTAEAFESAAHELMKWDGHLPMPVGPLNPPEWASIAGSNRDTKVAEIQDRYEERVQSGGLRLRKLRRDPTLRNQGGQGDTAAP